MKAAKSKGMATMLADGFAKCCEGITTVEELGRVVAED
jgi:type II secretory ATPase GspE/PulE/Tfp pilus assembly ATPase PilB-like protein